MKTMLLLGAAIAPLAFAMPALAQSGAAADPQGPVTSLEEVIVTGEPVMRNRTDDVVPTLSYDREYFQRFEPLTVGDALKRVPSVTFLSDVLESDGARLRGLDPGYTKILIDGEEVPGANLDRSFFVDRIPAELIERVEVVRSSSANRSGDAVAGTINIVLRDAMSLDGGYVRLGALAWSDSEYGQYGGTYGAVWGGAALGGRLLLGANVQDRRNPKDKYSIRYDEPGGTIVNTEVQTDVRDGTDYAVNAAYEADVAGGVFDIAAVFVRTDRYQDEDSIEYIGGIENDANLTTINDNDLDIRTDNLSIRTGYQREMLGGETAFKLAYASIDDEQYEFEGESEYRRDAIIFPDEDRYTLDSTTTDIKDEEWKAAIEHKLDLSNGVELEFGLQGNWKNRDSLITETPRIRFNVPNAPAPRPPVPAFGPSAPVPGGDVTIEENRLDPYVMLSGENGPLTWEAGLRYETTDLTITDRTAVAPDPQVYEREEAEVLPSASLRWALSGNDRIIFSAARTVRRPNFNFLSPVTLRGELGDNDLEGNPELKPELATGFDLGFERRLGRRGVAGVNLFYRDVQDRIEYVNTGTITGGIGDDTTYLYTVENVGDGKVYGVEFDLSTPLDFIGMESTGVFLNYSWLDSEIEDAFGERRFNGQSDYVFNAGFTQDLPAWGAAFGATYREQGDAFDRFVGEEIRTSYGADLEVFVEKRFASNVIVRLTGSNLLDSSKDEIFDKFTTEANQRKRQYDEYELETETAGPVYQAVMRVAF